jgi:lysyl-tRNA synthetase class II
MTRILRSATKKTQSIEDLPSKLSISKKSKVIKRNRKIVIKSKDEASQQSGVWDNKSIVSSIFSFINHKDLVEFNTVCKKWNN